MDVIGIGDADIDIYLDVDHLPGRDEKIRAQKFALYPGGMVANFLVALRRLGTSCGFHGPIGDDEFGQLALDNLIANQVDTRGVIIRPGGKTYFCVVLLDESGEKSLVVAQTDCVYPEPGDLSETLIAEARHLHTTADNIVTLEEAIDIARRNNLSISLDIEPSAARHFRELWPMLANVDLVLIKDQALLSLTEKEDVDAAQAKLLAHGVKIVCATMGAAGAVVATKEESVKVDAFPVQVIDSTGAGDAFAAAYVHAFLQNWPAAKATKFASAVGAITVSNYGGHAGAPTSEKVWSFLSKNDVLDKEEIK